MQLCNLTKSKFFQVGQLKQCRGDRAIENVINCIHERNEIHQQPSEDKYSKNITAKSFQVQLTKINQLQLGSCTNFGGDLPRELVCSQPFRSIPYPTTPCLCKTRKWTKKWIQLALDIIINDWINSRKSNTFNAFALPISEAYLDSTPRVWVIQTDSVAMYRLIYCHLKNWSTKSVKVPEKEYQHINWMTTLT